MRIVTAGSDHYKYRLTIDYTLESAKKFGYDTSVYDLGGLGIGAVVDDRRCDSPIRQPKFSLKPELALWSAEASTGTVAWIDGDAILLRNIDDIDQDDTFDVGFTVRPKARVKKTHYINAGVFFVKCNDAAIRFMKLWIKNIIPAPEDLTIKHQGFCDQEVLEEKILLPALGVSLWNLVGKVFVVNRARVKFFDCARYNNFWLHEQWVAPMPETRILHFKNHSMKKLPAYRKEFLDGQP